MQLLDSEYVYRRIIMPSGGNRPKNGAEAELNGCIKEVTQYTHTSLVLVHIVHYQWINVKLTPRL